MRSKRAGSVRLVSTDANGEFKFVMTGEFVVYNAWHPAIRLVMVRNL